MLEVDRTGKETFTYRRPNNELIMKALKLRNGDIVCISSTPDPAAPTQKLVRLNAEGKELLSFAVDARTFGGKLDVSAAGRILVPQL